VAAVFLLPAACALNPQPALEQTLLAPLPYAGELQDALDEALQAGQGRHDLGLSAAVIVPSYQMWTGVSGNSQPGAPITPEMVFDVGSIAKTFEAALALRLAEQGKLDLDDPISRWLPAYKNVDGAITVRQLLNHTSGVFNAFDHPDFPEGGEVADYGKPWTVGEVFNSYALEPYAPPGVAQRYATTNYLLLTALLEQAGGASVPDQAANSLLIPLGLEQTVMTAGEAPPTPFAAAHPWVDIDQDGELDDISEIPRDWWASLTHPLVYATPADLARWIFALYLEGAVLEPGSLEEMLTFPDVADPDPHGVRYGLGVVDYSIPLGVRAYGHGGSSPGYEAAALYLPEYGAVLAWAFNTGESPGGPADALMMETWWKLSGVLQERLTRLD
jgi:D-alanyl-D-alanine carboxypeptidase